MKLTDVSRLMAAALTLLFSPGWTSAQTNEPARYDIPADKQLDPGWVKSLFARGERKVYRGPELETIGMPCGGIAAGQLYVRGDGTLAQWWIDNTGYDTGSGLPGICESPLGSYQVGYQTAPHRPPSPVDQGFAIAVRRPGDPAMVRRLSRDDFGDIGFVGEYPIATIRYGTKGRPALPVEIQAEVYSPWIPTNTRDSANPATVLRYTIRNTTGRPLDVAIGGWLQNLVWLGRDGSPAIQRRNRVVQRDGLVAVSMDLTAPTEQALPARDPQRGEVLLAALDGQAAASAEMTSVEAFLRELAAEPSPKLVEKLVPLKTKLCGAVVSKFRLEPKQSKTATFLVAWYFPHRVLVVGNPYPEKDTEVGNMYGNWYTSVLDVAEYIRKNFDRLDRDTHLFRDTYYDTTLPYWFAQRLTMPVSTLATETVQWWRNGRFWGWEGVGSCLGTCGHVYNSAQAHARLFPDLARSILLMQDLGPAFDPQTGRIGFRGVKGDSTAVSGASWGYAADAQAGYVLKVYREHLLSRGRDFLDRTWPQTRKTLEYLISHDGNEDGIIEDQQHTTWDADMFGPNSYVGTYYLAALRAGEEMARLERENALADRYRRMYESGRRFILDQLWNGEYFIQLPAKDGPKKATTQYGNGCLSHQLAGQTWADQLDLGCLYPSDQIATTLQSIYRYNWTPDVGLHPAYQSANPRHKEYPRVRPFALPGEAGLIECTWPKGKQGASWYGNFPLHEVFSGTEYTVAAQMLHEGLLREGLSIVRGIQDRYDGAKRNPWNEIECGDHYARAMASWSCLMEASGFIYDGPAGKIGFVPRLTPEAFKCFFSAAEGWGSIAQQRKRSRQISRVELKWGQLRLRTLVLEVPPGANVSKVKVVAAGQARKAALRQEGQRVTVDLKGDITLEAGQAAVADLAW